MYVPLDLIFLTASLKCLGLTGCPASPITSILLSASSTTSPAKTLAMPAIAITTFWPTLQPVIVCISFLMVALGRAALLYMAYLSNWSSLKLETRSCIFSLSSCICSFLIRSCIAAPPGWGVVGVSSKGVELPGAAASVLGIWLRSSLGRLGGSLVLGVLGKWKH